MAGIFALRVADNQIAAFGIAANSDRLNIVTGGDVAKIRYTIANGAIHLGDRHGGA